MPLNLTLNQGLLSRAELSHPLALVPEKKIPGSLRLEQAWGEYHRAQDGIERQMGLTKNNSGFGSDVGLGFLNSRKHLTQARDFLRSGDWQSGRGEIKLALAVSVAAGELKVTRSIDLAERGLGFAEDAQRYGTTLFIQGVTGTVAGSVSLGYRLFDLARSVLGGASAGGLAAGVFKLFGKVAGVPEEKLPDIKSGMVIGSSLGLMSGLAPYAQTAGLSWAGGLANSIPRLAQNILPNSLLYNRA